ncbi:uncharacterized protein CC84DRAFT_799973 [Paraphaeosphaeria sporulosa]|uniref:Uncharacterized protein n=1 Tax=Paraphaeosphaeria sporulosa TaxID=1460663 RepID=A0A177CBC9_9PLEO|nr:uncharacterized protein CC84DRAFT_799973 [Paraphaeosphaeria sporulosa]OAG04636.1 hypothetical protein CC84DRAFT_799973 [Paraphaeosphaeria sporulosa]
MLSRRMHACIFDLFAGTRTFFNRPLLYVRHTLVPFVVPSATLSSASVLGILGFLSSRLPRRLTRQLTSSRNTPAWINFNRNGTCCTDLHFLRGKQKSKSASSRSLGMPSCQGVLVATKPALETTNTTLRPQQPTFP